MRNKRFIILLNSIFFLILAIGLAMFFCSTTISNTIMGNFVLKAGKPMKFGNYTVFIEKIENNRLFGIKIYSKNRKLEAKSGDYVYIPKEKAIKFNLIDGVAEEADSKNPSIFRRLTFEQMLIKVRLKTSL